jgi:hypothetical protein
MSLTVQDECAKTVWLTSDRELVSEDMAPFCFPQTKTDKLKTGKDLFKRYKVLKVEGRMRSPTTGFLEYKNGLCYSTKMYN